MIGTTIGPFQIVGKLGEGGMGQVYRATDTNLKRPVAIKVLPDALASDPDRLARFQREAEVLASLNHPNIAAIYGVEEAPAVSGFSQTVRALVLELVDGPTLADRIAQGPIPVDEALPIARQIAEAVEAAHEHGIIHRDLKPANIKLREDGTVKVLDFGLAKLHDPNAPNVPNDPNVLTLSPTITSPAVMTSAGMILGTAAYMSPEQARGRAVDRRTDIWAFGCVLYEMLTGRRAFDGGDSVSDSVAAILKGEPDWSALPSATPPAIRTLIRRCLQKERQKRLPHIGLARLEIQDAPDTAAAGVAAGPGRRAWMTAAAAAVAIAIASAFTAWTLLPSDTAAAITYASIGLEPAERLGHTPVQAGTLTRTSIALSPDGRTLVFTGSDADGSRLYRRSLERPLAEPLAGTEGAMNPFFSPDGASVGFWADGQLQRLSLTGGPPVPLVRTAAIAGASWGDDDAIVYASSAGGLWRIPASGGTATELTRVNEDGVSHRLPSVLPGGEAVLFTEFIVSRRWEEAQIVVQSLRTGERQVLLENGAHAVYSETGHIVFARLGTLWVAPFDPATLTLTGAAVPVLDTVAQAAGISGIEDDTGAAQFAISRSGTLVYLPGGLLPPDLRRLVWVDRSGRVEPLDLPRGEYWGPRVSPDGTRVAVSEQGDSRILVTDLRRNVTQRLPGSGVNVGAWSPDGSEIAFGWVQDGARNLFRQRVDGSAPAERLTTSPNNQFAGLWSAGGELLFAESMADTGRAIRVVEPAAGAAPRSVLDDSFWEEYPALSPDGRWLAYASNESGRHEVYVRAYPALDGKQQISVAGGYMPAWAPDGRELFYVQPLTPGRSQIWDSGAEVMMMAVPIDVDGELRPGTPSELFRLRLQPGGWIRTYDVAPDGRFLMVERDPPHATAEASLLRIVFNWHQELARLVPAR